MTPMWIHMISFKKFIIAAMAAFLLPLLAESKVYLVSVGISDYKGVDMDLRLSADDAKTMTWLYSKNTELQYVQLLNEKATIGAISSAMNKVFSNAGQNDIVVFFYSGHGYPGGFAVYDGKLSYSVIRKAMAKSKCRNKMIFADACFSGKLRDAKDKSTSSTKDIDVMLFLSSRHNEASIERPQMVNGFFTACLLKCLKGGADIDRNRIITAKELYQEVSRGVKTLSNDQQHPVMWGNFDHDMTIMKW